MRDLTGQTFGRLTAERMIGMTLKWKRNVYIWKCRCECGEVASVTQPQLVYGRTKSCGCLRRENALKLNGFGE
jgi:hypothetical protein